MTDDEEFLAAPLERQRQMVSDCMGLGPGWNINEDRFMWQRLLDTLISVREHDGLASFWREIGRMQCR